MSTVFESGVRWSTYLEELQAEQEAFARFKWLESERAGMDIGEDRARWVWLTRERAIWLRSIRPAQS